MWSVLDSSCNSLYTNKQPSFVMAQRWMQCPALLSQPSHKPPKMESEWALRTQNHTWNAGRSASPLPCLLWVLCSLPDAFLIAVANSCSICRCGLKSPGGLCFRKEHCCVQMLILGCAANDFNYPETSSHFGLAFSQLASLSFLPRGLQNLSGSSFLAFQDLVKPM